MDGDHATLSYDIPESRTTDTRLRRAPEPRVRTPAPPTRRGAASVPASGGPRHRHSKVSPRVRRNRRRAAVILVLVVVLGWFAISFGAALTNPTYGSSLGARGAEWVRQHGGNGIVNWIENEWYSHHQPKVGGKPPAGAFAAARAGATKTHTTTAPTVAHLPVPAPMVSPASPALPGEGQWTPVGRPVDGIPAVYETSIRPDAIHTSYVVGVAWMDTKLLRATLYSGSQIPGGGPYAHTAPVSATDASTLVAAFNAGFLMSDANGGYYTDNQTVPGLPLKPGAASFVIYSDGSVNIGSWGTEVTMAPDVVSVRQNLSLIVDNGQPVPGLNAADTHQWGLTLGNAVYVWRSAIGITANGALVYVGGPGLNITDLASLLVRAGAVRGMELDINTDWVNYSTYQPSTPTGLANGANGTELVPAMTGTPGRYFEPWWARDFFTMSARTSSTGKTATGKTPARHNPTG